jgi:hypothetical protein
MPFMRLGHTSILVINSFRPHESIGPDGWNKGEGGHKEDRDGSDRSTGYSRNRDVGPKATNQWRGPNSFSIARFELTRILKADHWQAREERSS